MSNLKLGVVGAGFVGSAVINGFDTNTVTQLVVDPKYNNNTIADLISFSPSITFVNVPTPSTETGDVEPIYVAYVLEQLAAHYYTGIVVVKSTITPDHLEKYTEQYADLRLVYNPEFLTEANSLNDFINPNMQVLGGTWEDCTEVERAYVEHSKVKTVPTFKVDITTASLIKYTVNSWLATKVSFMNELYMLHKASLADSTWEQFTEILRTDPRIGNTHLQVPGPDGKFGFGGHCFPKDTAALLNYAANNEASLTVLDSAVKINLNLRKS